MSKQLAESLRAALAALADAPALFDERGFTARAAALDTLEFAVLSRIDALSMPDPELLALREAADELRRRLEEVDAALFARLRAEVRAGRLRGPALLTLIEAYAGEVEEAGRGYGALDVLLNGLLGIAEPPAPTLHPAPEMVGYQKTPALLMLELLRRARLTADDLLYDLGSGLGHIPLLVALLSEARARGVEVEPAYCASARARATDLGLTRATFLEADARAVDYGEGTVFFLFTPFAGQMLRAVLGRLREAAQGRVVRIFTYGPCTVAVAREPWLAPVGALNPATLTEFRSR